MLRYALLLFCCFCFLGNTYAQQNLKGQVFENNTRIPLAGIRIENTRTKQKTETNIKGRFSIDAKASDVLIFQGFAYQTDTLFLVDLKFHEVFLEPGKNMLKQVDVHNKEVNTSGWTDPAFHGQTAIYSRNGDGSYKGGVTFRIWSNHAAERKREKYEKLAYEESVRIEIERVFSAASLMKYLPLKPEEVSSFTSRYAPSVKVYRSDDFNLLLYLNGCYKKFVKLPEAQRLENKLQ